MLEISVELLVLSSPNDTFSDDPRLNYQYYLTQMEWNY